MLGEHRLLYPKERHPCHGPCYAAVPRGEDGSALPAVPLLSLAGLAGSADASAGPGGADRVNETREGACRDFAILFTKNARGS
jgi:hypothetical protein